MNALEFVEALLPKLLTSSWGHTVRPPYSGFNKEVFYQIEPFLTAPIEYSASYDWGDRDYGHTKFAKEHYEYLVDQFKEVVEKYPELFEYDILVEKAGLSADYIWKEAKIDP